MITCWSLPGHPKTNFIVCLTTWSTSCTDAQIQTSVNLQYDHGDLMLWKMLILHVAWSNKIIVQIIFIKGIYCWALIDTLDQPFTHNVCARCDKIWPLIHFWHHHLWPKLASSILKFCRRKIISNDTQIRVIGSMEPEICTKCSEIWVQICFYYK